MKRISVLIILLLGLSQLSFITQKSTKLISRSWIMSKMDMGQQQYSEEMMERQRSNGIKTVLQFTPNGACYIRIITPNGSTTKKNTWKIMEGENQLVMYPEEKSQVQTFDIIKLTSKVMILSIDDDGIKSTFHYKAYKE
jgi:hypothetical protein